VTMVSDPNSGIRFKDIEQFEQFLELPDRSPALLSLLLLLQWYAARHFNKSICITSIFRPEGNHSNWKMADIRIEAGRDQIEDITHEEANQMIAYANEVFLYGVKANGDPTVCLHPRYAELDHHEETTNDHVHCQVPLTRWHGRGRTYV
jgi:hypothetical protein